MQGLNVDFDGVINSYTSGWTGDKDLPDPPVEGAFEFLTEAVKHFDVYIFSTRCLHEGADIAMVAWMIRHGLDAEVLKHLTLTPKKHPAILTIDDRGFCFKGAFPTMEFIKNFKPWNKQ